MNSKRCGLAFALAATLAQSASAGVGATQSEFLKIGLSARAAGMAGAFGAVADDLGALEYNPAGLGLLENSQVSMMYSRWLADINFGSIAGAHVIPFLGTIGLGLNLLDVGAIDGSTVKTFNASSFLLRAAWARSLRDDLTVGAGLKVLNEKISDFTSSGGTVDGGALYTPVRGLTVGASVMNLGTVSAFEQTKDALPLLVKVGAAYKGLEGEYGMLIGSVDLDYYPAPAELFNPTFGAEYWGGKYFALRAGYTVRQTDLSSLVGFAAGIGVRWESLRMDYAFAPFASLGTTHRIALNWEIWPLVSLPVPGSNVGELRSTSTSRVLPPAPPFVAAEPGEANALLKWEAPQSSSIAGYNIYLHKEGEKEFKKYNDEPVTVTTLIVGGLTTNVRYVFIVRSVDDAHPPRESAPSPQATTIPY